MVLSGLQAFSIPWGAKSPALQVQPDTLSRQQQRKSVTVVELARPNSLEEQTLREKAPDCWNSLRVQVANS